MNLNDAEHSAVEDSNFYQSQIEKHKEIYRQANKPVIYNDTSLEVLHNYDGNNIPVIGRTVTNEQIKALTGVDAIAFGKRFFRNFSRETLPLPKNISWIVCRGDAKTIPHRFLEIIPLNITTYKIPFYRKNQSHRTSLQDHLELVRLGHNSLKESSIQSRSMSQESKNFLNTPVPSAGLENHSFFTHPKSKRKHSETLSTKENKKLRELTRKLRCVEVEQEEANNKLAQLLEQIASEKRKIQSMAKISDSFIRFGSNIVKFASEFEVENSPIPDPNSQLSVDVSDTESEDDTSSDTTSFSDSSDTDISESETSGNETSLIL